jgi:SM-20-related protein
MFAKAILIFLSFLGASAFTPSYRYHGTSSSTKLSMVAANPGVSNISDQSIKELGSKGYVVLPDFLSPALVSSLNQDVKSLRNVNKFKVARIGQDFSNTLNTDIRIAETCFIGESKLQDIASTDRNMLYNLLDQTRQSLSGNVLLDEISPTTGELDKGAPALDKSLSELLYAYYPEGGFYRRHVDAVPNSASILRSYSLLLYLNKDWKESDGGHLRIHLDSGGDFLPAGEEPNYVDIEPRGGTLVLFKSDKIPHEVLDTNSERVAVVGWYNRPYSSADLSSLASEEDQKKGMMLMMAAGLVVTGLGMIIVG